MLKENLTYSERMALGRLVELCSDLGLLVNDEEDGDWLHTTGEYLNLESFEKKDWELCLNAIGRNVPVSDDSEEKWEYIHDIRAFVEGNPDYKLHDAFDATYKDGTMIVLRWLEIDHDTDDVFCLITKEPDEVNCVMLSDLTLESIIKLYESIVETEIDHGWDWVGHANDVLSSAFPDDEPEDRIPSYVAWDWNNLLTDAENIRAFRKFIKNQ